MLPGGRPIDSHSSSLILELGKSPKGPQKTQNTRKSLKCTISQKTRAVEVKSFCVDWIPKHLLIITKIEDLVQGQLSSPSFEFPKRVLLDVNDERKTNFDLGLHRYRFREWKLQRVR